MDERAVRLRTSQDAHQLAVNAFGWVVKVWLTLMIGYFFR